MKRLYEIAAGILLGSISVSTYAAESADMSMRGVIRPSACNLTLSAQSFDYGTISTSQLKASGDTRLELKPFDIQIACDGPTRVAIVATDGRAGSAASATINHFGLGLVDGKPVGSFLLWVGDLNSLADGEIVAEITSENGGQSWQETTNWYLDHNPNNRLSWGPSGAISPAAYSSIQQSVVLDTYIVGKDQLPTGNDAIPLDGLATISLVYL